MATWWPRFACVNPKVRRLVIPLSLVGLILIVVIASLLKTYG